MNTPSLLHTHRELFNAARPQCHRIDCEQSIQRVECCYTPATDTDGQWNYHMVMVCEYGHPTPLLPFDG
jgi:hypothetical protein